MWQDLVITIGSIIFGIVLLPQLYDCIKNNAVVNLYTASLTSVILGIFCICYFTLGMYLASIPLTATIWALIAVFSFKNHRAALDLKSIQNAVS